MGEVRSMDPWKNDRIFTGLAVGYPVELFIDLIEREANEADNKDSQMCDSAWNQIHAFFKFNHDMTLIDRQSDANIHSKSMKLIH